jgi:hypothetical protein
MDASGEGCFAFARRGRATRSLEVPSIPTLGPRKASFAACLQRCLRTGGFTHVEVNSYGSAEALIPTFPNETRRTRIEWRLDLTGAIDLSTNHRRSLRKAVAAVAVIERTTSIDHVPTHLQLITASLQRRTDRGEAAAFGAGEEELLREWLKEGAGELFRVWIDGITVSSMFVLRSQSGAYYHSAGTDVLGMASGASVFLVSEVARLLATEGCRTFNLGGAWPEAGGLARFKSGFGSRPVHLEACTARFQPAWKAPFTALLHRINDFVRHNT